MHAHHEDAPNKQEHRCHQRAPCRRGQRRPEAAPWLQRGITGQGPALCWTQRNIYCEHSSWMLRSTAKATGSNKCAGCRA